MNEDDIRAQVRQRISAIMSDPHAKGATNLAEYLAYESDASVEDCIGALKAFHADLGNKRIQTSPAQSWEDRKRAAGALGLAPLDSESGSAQSIWDAATANAHKFRGIEDPEVGATGRKLQ